MHKRRQKIINTTIVTMNEEKEIINNGILVIEGDEIGFAGDQEAFARSPFAKMEFSKEEICDGKQGILMPGMINAHTHASMVVFRSLADDVPDRLKRYIFPLEKALVNEKLVYTGAKYGIAEMLLGGVTTFCDSYYYEEAVAKAAEEMGIRGVLGETIVDFVAPDATKPYEGLKIAEEFIQEWKDHPLITPAVAPHAPYTNSTQKLQEAHRLAKKYGVPVIMHVAEMGYEQDKYADEYGMSPVEYLDSIQVLGDKFIGAHFVNVSDKDLDILAKNNVGISHNVGANSKGAKGVAPAVKMYQQNQRIGLGTDGPMSGNTLDIFTQMALVGKVHKLHKMDRSIFPAKEIVEMATIGGARALGMEDRIGSIEVGKQGDLVLLETDSINMNPIYDYYSTVVYSANPSNVFGVWVNGKQLVDRKTLVGQSLKELTDEIRCMQKDIVEYVENMG